MAYKIYYTIDEVIGAIKGIRRQKEKILEEEVYFTNLASHLRSHCQKVRRTKQVFISEHGEIFETGIHPHPYKKKEKVAKPEKEKKGVPYWVTQREGKPYEVRG